MIKNWNEIDMEMFKEILDSYWNKEDWTLDKVLEIQYLDKILDNKSSTRVYLGNGININEWKDFNKSTLDLMDMLTDMFIPDIFPRKPWLSWRISRCKGCRVPCLLSA